MTEQEMKFEDKGGVPWVNGAPAARVWNSAEEKIGLPNYSNVTIHAGCSKYVAADDASIERGMQECIAQAEQILVSERAKVLKMTGNG